jgi:hypothetical protein
MWRNSDYVRRKGDLRRYCERKIATYDEGICRCAVPGKHEFSHTCTEVFLSAGRHLVTADEIYRTIKRCAPPTIDCVRLGIKALA